MPASPTVSRCRWKAAKHNGQPCPYHTALQRMVTAADRGDYAAYERAKEDAKRHEGVDRVSGFQRFLAEFNQQSDATAQDDIAAIETSATRGYDPKHKPGIMTDATAVAEHDGATLYDTGFTRRRSGVTYHNGDESSTREQMVARIDELFVAGNHVQARGLLGDLNAIDSRMAEKGWMLEASLAPENTFAALLAQAEASSITAADLPAADVPAINFDAELLTSDSGIVKTFSTDGAEQYARLKIGFTAQEMEQITPEMVTSLSAKNAQHRQDVLAALRTTTDQETRESIAMPFIHAVEFDRALDAYPDGPYRRVMKAEVAGMLQYASRLAKYQAGRKYADDTDIFIETRLGDLRRHDEDGADRAPQMSLQEKLIANGVSRQVDIDTRAYDDALWGSYAAEAQTYSR